MIKPVYKVGDVVKYMGRQGTIIEAFKEVERPKTSWRYIVRLRTGDWSVPERSIEKKVKSA